MKGHTVTGRRDVTARAVTQTGREGPRGAAPPGQVSRTGTLAQLKGRHAGRVAISRGPGQAADLPPPQSCRPMAAAFSRLLGGCTPHVLLPQWLDQSPPGHVSQHRLHQKHEPVYTAGLLTGSSEGRVQCHHELAHGDSHLRNMLKRVTEQGTGRAQDAVWKPRQPHHAGLPPEGDRRHGSRETANCTGGHSLASEATPPRGDNSSRVCGSRAGALVTTRFRRCRVQLPRPPHAVKCPPVRKAAPLKRGQRALEHKARAEGPRGEAESKHSRDCLRIS